MHRQAGAVAAIDSARRPRLMLVHFWGSLHDLRGSVQQIIDTQCRHLQGFDIAVAYVGEAQPAQQIPGVEYFAFREDAWRNRCLNKILGLKVFTFSQLPRLIEAWRPDILHLHNRQETLPALLKRLSYRPACVLHYHRHFQNPALPAADLCLLPSAASQAYFAQLHPHRPWQVLANPVDAQALAIAPLPAQPAPGPARLLFSGGVQPGKGFDLLRAAVDASMPVSVQVCGRDLERLQGLDARWHLASYLQRPAYLRQLAEAEVVVLPSLTESFGLAAMEAAAAARYLVLSDLPAFRELLPADAAWFFRCADVEDLRRALKEALAARQAGDLRRPQAARAAATAYDTAHFIARLERLYQDLLDSR